MKLPLHCDGARLFNAAEQMGVPAASLVEPCDSVSVCLSKGLGAPVGSVVVGNENFIARYCLKVLSCLNLWKWLWIIIKCQIKTFYFVYCRCKRMRKALGGGMRQSGVLAAAGLYALSNNLPKLKRDNEVAQHLSKGKLKASRNMK